MAENPNFYANGNVNSTEKGTGARANRGKISLSTVPLHLLHGVARVFMGGGLKYAPFNWSKGMRWSICFDCTMRHLIKWWYCNEELDTESGEHHIDHALANLLILRHYLIAYKEGNDRPPTFTGFADALDDFNTRFDEAAYLKRNPEIEALIEARNDV